MEFEFGLEVEVEVEVEGDGGGGITTNVLTKLPSDDDGGGGEWSVLTFLALSTHPIV